MTGHDNPADDGTSERVKLIVDSAPPLDEEQRCRLAVLLRPCTEHREAA